jgi:protein-L-isoaspartate(D-aspartate) O-methyltransferase
VLACVAVLANVIVDHVGGFSKGTSMFKSKRPTDYDQARAWMVEKQLVARGISDGQVLQAMREVPRHLFVPETQRTRAYDDRPLSINYGQTISQPYIVALMTAFLELTGQEKVLEIGTGSGYQAAVLSRVVRQVISIERIEELARPARTRLENLGYDNVQVIIGDGGMGFPEQAPFEAIMLTAAAPEVPPPLYQQMADGGRLVGPVGSHYDQALVRLRRRGDEWKREMLTPVRFVPLLGKYG